MVSNIGFLTSGGLLTTSGGTSLVGTATCSLAGAMTATLIREGIASVLEGAEAVPDPIFLEYSTFSIMDSTTHILGEDLYHFLGGLW